jgi:two-component system, LytTR family, response regulator LytT
VTALLRTFIVDDEAPARRELRYLLEQVQAVEVVGEAANGTAALKGIRETRPQLVFLDIMMPGLSGLELAQFLAELPERPLLVFATAFDSYALQAFEVDALDFLCKPLTLERVARTVAKARKAVAPEAALPGPHAQHPLGPCRKVILYRGETIVPTSAERIILARAVEGEVFAHVIDGRYRIRGTLNELEQKLAAAGFVRTHRSFLVNINHVSEVIPWFNGSFKLIMGDRERSEVPVSRYHVKELKRHFDL